METQFNSKQVEQIRQEIFNSPQAKDIDLESNINKVELLGDDYYFIFIDILTDYCKLNNADENTVISILDGSYIPTDYYKNNSKNNQFLNTTKYYQTLDKGKFNKDFEDNFERGVRDLFKKELITLEQLCPRTGQIFTLQNYWAEHGATIKPGSIKGLANDQKVDVKKYNLAELRVSGQGSSAKPTIYIGINTDNNYIFLGTCHKKGNGDKGEEPYISRCFSLYKKYLEYEEHETTTEKNIINVEKDL